MKDIHKTYFKIIMKDKDKKLSLKKGKKKINQYKQYLLIQFRIFNYPGKYVTTEKMDKY